jgi:hypothetical protein
MNEVRQPGSVVDQDWQDPIGRWIERAPVAGLQHAGQPAQGTDNGER